MYVSKYRPWVSIVVYKGLSNYHTFTSCRDFAQELVLCNTEDHQLVVI